MKTSLGEIRIRLFPDKVPDTVGNFLGYVSDRFYDGTIFHRVVGSFMIQGGGYTADLTQKSTKAPIRLEDPAGLSNKAGTVAMAHAADPHSATSQFFINTTDNFFLDAAKSGGRGFTVFGEVVTGMEVVRRIQALKTSQKKGMNDVPNQPVIIESVQLAASADASDGATRPRRF